MIKKLLEKLKQNKLEKLNNKPTYQLKELYVGEIVFYEKYENMGHGKVDHYYRDVKKFALLTRAGYDKYLHIKSNQTLIEMGGFNSATGDYAVRRIREFQTACPIYMRKKHYTASTKVSKAFIEQFEIEMNELLRPEQEVVEIFK